MTGEAFAALARAEEACAGPVEAVPLFLQAMSSEVGRRVGTELGLVPSEGSGGDGRWALERAFLLARCFYPGRDWGEVWALSCLERPDSLLSRMLGRQKVPRSAVLEQLEQRLLAGDPGTELDLNLVSDMAAQGSAPHVSEKHYLLALLKRDDSLAVRTLREHADLPSLVEDCRAEPHGPAYSYQADSQQLQPLIRIAPEHLLLAASMLAEVHDWLYAREVVPFRFQVTLRNQLPEVPREFPPPGECWAVPASQEAYRLASPTVEPIHFLLGLLDDPQCLAYEALEGRVRRSWLEERARGSGRSEKMRVGPEALAAMERMEGSKESARVLQALLEQDPGLLPRVCEEVLDRVAALLRGSLSRRLPVDVDGVRPGMTLAEVEASLGPPAASSLPDESCPCIAWTYPGPTCVSFSPVTERVVAVVGVELLQQGEALLRLGDPWEKARQVLGPELTVELGETTAWALATRRIGVLGLHAKEIESGER